MHGLLISDPTQLNPNLRFMWSTYYCESGPAPTTPDAVQQITAILTQHQPALDPATRERVRTELMALLPWVSDCSGELLEFVLLVALQHHTLPTDERARREARITAVLTNHFGPAAGWKPDRATTLDGVRRTAVLTPDDLLDNHLRSVCGSMDNLWTQAQFKQTSAVLTPAEIAARNQQFMTDMASAGGQMTVYQALQSFYSHALPGERQQRRDRVNRIAASTKKMRLCEYIKSVSAAETSARPTSPGMSSSADKDSRLRYRPAEA